MYNNYEKENICQYYSDIQMPVLNFMSEKKSIIFFIYIELEINCKRGQTLFYKYYHRLKTQN